ncbi:hypothetical protein SAMN04515647_1650 [Cohaesibacter sp. ES.047]|uniref:hypothetical protein n=1 Tax=Cohaesibacter sp. ES.047 TaxID=1798205 RepID=UPI000BB99798|nr:hypothetical protein [Cohaesibacter sp. ES.047]SNY91429.1 hypothetical protein SAMN04515647_1650 [Cohaesibacter sp. ES.047]
MKKWLAALVIVIPTSAFAQMDDLTFFTEMSALAKTVAIQEECSIAVDADAMMSFVAHYFEGRESDVLAQLDGQVMVAKMSLEKASDLQKKVLCSATEKYVGKHKLGTSQ